MDSKSALSFNYPAFEAFFRGPRQEIKERLSVYLPLITLLPPLSSKPALDIGCGRGEWLELLSDNYINAFGIDSNQVFIEYCNECDFKAEMANLFDFLPSQIDEKYSLITGFHLIEHIPAEKQLWFLSSVFRMLSPGGIVIFETPNPENVTVGSCNFFIDPTHQRPIPPLFLQFLASEAGFASPLIARLNRNTVGAPLTLMAESEPGAALYNQLLGIIASRLLQAPDYALIAFKPPAPDNDMLEAVSGINKINDSFILQSDSGKASHEQELLLLHQQSTRLEHELQHINQRIQQLNVVNITSSSGEHIVPLNEYPEALRNTYQQLVTARIQSKIETP